MPPPSVTLRAAAPCAALDAGLAPASPAAVLLSDASGAPIFLATTADARAFLRKRLGPPPDQRDPGATDAARRAAATDLASIAACVEVWSVGSGLEADLTFLDVARARMPATADALTERWRSWFIHYDPGARAPAWRKTNLGDLATIASSTGDPQGVDPACLIGPVATKDSAGRLGEALDDAFDLCRFPRELAQAPRGTPCAYKEMGRCPAPCDGSEPMDAFRARADDALATLRLDPALRGRAFEALMHRAAEAHEYERAAGLRSRLDRLEVMGKPALREARPLDTFRFVGVLGAGRAGWARLWRIDPWSCRAVMDVDASRPREAAASALAIARTLVEPPADRADASARPLDPVLLGIIGRHLLVPAARRRGGFLRVGADPSASLDSAAVSRLLRSAARLEHADVEEFDRATLA